MNKLVKVGLLCDLVQTTDGSNCYLTQKQVEIEITNILQEKQIVNVQKDIVDQIGVPRDIIIQFFTSAEKQVQHKLKYIEVKDIAVTEKYISQLIKDIEDKIQKNGKVYLQSEVCEVFGLPLKFVTEQIRSFLSLSENCTLEQDTLISKDFEKKQD